MIDQGGQLPLPRGGISLCTSHPCPLGYIICSNELKFTSINIVIYRIKTIKKLLFTLLQRLNRSKKYPHQYNQPAYNDQVLIARIHYTSYIYNDQRGSIKPDPYGCPGQYLRMLFHSFSFGWLGKIMGYPGCRIAHTEKNHNEEYCFSHFGF